MNKFQLPNIKQNVRRFDDDVRKLGAYEYTGERQSMLLANNRISRSIAESFDFHGASVLDLGCGDGAYTVEFADLGVLQVLGLDPAALAIDVARTRAKDLGVEDKVHFDVGNIYNVGKYIASGQFDCIVIRGVLHHLPDPARALAGLASFNGTLVILEPNGNNPVLKFLERFSRYHIDHEERSFRPGLICSWINASGLSVQSYRFLNLVPFFCPDIVAKLLSVIEPLVERLPFLRDIACGQIIITARR